MVKYKVMQTAFYIFIFIFGTIIGSFLNVVICRHGTGRSLGGRSKCAVTGKTLKWYELIPILSFIIQGGRSRYSKTKISWQYPLVEFFTGFLFVLMADKLLKICFDLNIFIVALIFYFVVLSFFVLIFVYDLRHQIIPDAFIFPLIFLSLVFVFLNIFLPTHFLLLNTGNLSVFLAGPIISMPIILIWSLTKGKGMGFGDVLLTLPIGWLLGVSSGFASLLVAFWIGAIFGIALIILGKKNMKDKIPFGPFLILGFILCLLYNIDMTLISDFFANLI